MKKNSNSTAVHKLLPDEIKMVQAADEAILQGSADLGKVERQLAQLRAHKKALLAKINEVEQLATADMQVVAMRVGADLDKERWQANWKTGLFTRLV